MRQNRGTPAIVAADALTECGNVEYRTAAALQFIGMPYGHQLLRRIRLCTDLQLVAGNADTVSIVAYKMKNSYAHTISAFLWLGVMYPSVFYSVAVPAHQSTAATVCVAFVRTKAEIVYPVEP